jgi:hypothetical protein
MLGLYALSIVWFSQHHSFQELELTGFDDGIFGLIGCCVLGSV